MKPNLLINVGLAVKNQPDNTVAVTLDVLASYHITVLQSAEFNSATEPTVVASIELPPESGLNVIYGAAVTLQQDCIAVWCPDTLQGQLVGPNSAAWGDFNPAYFIDFTGRAVG